MEFYFTPDQDKAVLIKVSIPNGMEFYDAQSWHLRQEQNVSIPNGMEFYRILRGFF